jgi:light-regulated signal transduction histidine kinase (bacteriophytochrome)
MLKLNVTGFDSTYAEEIFIVFKRLHSYHEYEERCGFIYL